MVSGGLEEPGGGLATKEEGAKQGQDLGQGEGGGGGKGQVALEPGHQSLGGLGLVLTVASAVLQFGPTEAVRLDNRKQRAGLAES